MTSYRTRGFSLIELAVVLVIIGLMLGGLLVPLSTQMETDKRKETTATLASIREALIGFSIINKRLPCPDTNQDGIENCSLTQPNGTLSFLPYADLGVSPTDAWGNTWRYMVTKVYTVTPITTATTPGNITIGTTSCANLLASNVPALVWSGGKTAYTTSTLETENTNTDTCYLDAGYRQGAQPFDDLLVWIPQGLLFSRMAAAGQL